MHILVSLADSCSSLVQASHGEVHIPTCLESTGCQWGHMPEWAASQVTSPLAGLPLAHHLPLVKHPAQGGDALISSKRGLQNHTVSNSGPSPWPAPRWGLYFHTLTAQPPLTGCENTTKDNGRETQGRELCHNREAWTLFHLPAAHLLVSSTNTRVCACTWHAHVHSTEALFPE